ncbi:hypothetical protein EC951288_4821B, partial [Escherichia coli 95.1288]
NINLRTNARVKKYLKKKYTSHFFITSLKRTSLMIGLAHC